MKQIKNLDDLVAWDKIYLIQWQGSANLARWTPKHDDDFLTLDGLAAPYSDVVGIVELCDCDE